MKIPDSIENLTTTVASDQFNLTPKLSNIPLDEIVSAFKRTLPSNILKDFETGIMYFKKDVTSEKAVIKNFLSLFGEYIVRAIDTSEIDVDTKDTITVQAKKTLEGLGESFESFYNLLIILNKQKNLLDVNCFLMIIIGYAISLFKKAHNSTNQ